MTAMVPYLLCFQDTDSGKFLYHIISISSCEDPRTVGYGLERILPELVRFVSYTPVPLTYTESIYD